MPDLYVQVFEVKNERVRLRLNIGPLCAKQLRLDGMEAQQSIGPRVDFPIEVGNKAAGKYLGTFPACARLHPGHFRPFEIPGRNPFTQQPGASERLVDVLGHHGSIALSSVRESLAPNRRRLRRYNGSN